MSWFPQVLIGIAIAGGYLVVVVGGVYLVMRFFQRKM